MKKYTVIFVLFASFILGAGCKSQLFHTGTIQKDGTHIRYWINDDDCRLHVRAEGTAPSKPYVIWLWQDFGNSEWILDTIKSTPYGIYTDPLEEKHQYSIWIEMDEELVGLGQFNL